MFMDHHFRLWSKWSDGWLRKTSITSEDVQQDFYIPRIRKSDGEKRGLYQRIWLPKGRASRSGWNRDCGRIELWRHNEGKALTAPGPWRLDLLLSERISALS